MLNSMKTGLTNKDAWRLVYEDVLPLWIHDLDPDIFGADHRRLCVWQDEMSGHWRWELETYSDLGVTAHGVAADRQAAMDTALASVRF